MSGGRNGDLVRVPQTSSEGLHRLQAIVNEQIGTDDLKEIVGKFVQKAKAGDVASGRFVIDYLLGAKHTPTAITVNQFFDGDSQATTVGVSAPQATPEQRIAVYLTAAGEATANVIAADTGIPVDEVVKILDKRPERFLVRGNKYSLHKAA
jgi:hypothetical protein